MSRIFSPQFKYSTWRKLWVALAKCEKAMGLNISAEQIASMEENIDNIDFKRVRELEIITRHDVVAHIHAFAELCPNAKGIIHLGATSSYITDNTDLIQMRAGLKLLKTKCVELIRIMRPLAYEYSILPTVGYTHFQPAQPISVGKRISMWMQDFLLDLQDMAYRENNLHFLGLKGAVGTQASFMDLLDGDSFKVEKLDELVAIEMGFEKLFTISGQTYTRKQDMQILSLLEGIGASVHKCATDLRLLAHLDEIHEPLGEKQVGSSAMPHKRNPIRAERACGLARFLMTLSQNGAQNFANQWLERSLDDSANRRLVIGEAFLAADAILNLMLTIFSDLEIDKEAISRSLKDKQSLLSLENILMALVKKGMDRQEAHEVLRQNKWEGEKVALELGLNLEELTACQKPNIGRSKEQVDLFLQQSVDPLLDEHKDLKCPDYLIRL